jgi:hypothetical protein
MRRLYVPRGESGARFHRALDDLQERFLVAKVPEEEEWRNGFIWDAFHRWMPSVVGAANSMASDEAAAGILTRYIRIVGAAADDDVVALFGWSPRLFSAAATRGGLSPAEVGRRGSWTIRSLWSGHVALQDFQCC